MLPVLRLRVVTKVAKGYSQRKNGKWYFRCTVNGERITEYVGDNAAKTRHQQKQAKQDKIVLPHVAHNNGNNEWYTPQAYIESARRIMDTIDTDPASSDIANKIVKASTFYTSKDDGRTKSWSGNIWLNPPYAQPLISEFCQLLLKKYWDKELSQACVLINNATETVFYQDMLASCNAVCFIKGRVKFVDESGKASGMPLQGQTILYFGAKVEAFIKEFSRYGVCLHGNC